MSKNEKKSKIICILGKTSTGKDTFVTEFLKLCPNIVNKAVSYTTRPRRQGETNEYHFVSKDKFDKLNFIEKTSYNVGDTVFEYGFTTDEFKDDVLNVVILNPRGLIEFENNQQFKDRIVKVYLKTSLLNRLCRYQSREKGSSSLDSRLVERLKQDEIDFDGFEKTNPDAIVLENNKVGVTGIVNELLEKLDLIS